MKENSKKSSRNKAQQSILSFVKSKPVKSRISEDEDENSEGTQHNGSQNFEVWMITLQKVTEKGGLCSTTSNKNTCENNTLHTKSKLSKGLIQLTELITDW